MTQPIVTGTGRCLVCGKDFVAHERVQAAWTICDCGEPAGFMYRSPRAIKFQRETEQ